MLINYLGKNETSAHGNHSIACGRKFSGVESKKKIWLIIGRIPNLTLMSYKKSSKRETWSSVLEDLSELSEADKTDVMIKSKRQLLVREMLSDVVYRSIWTILCYILTGGLMHKTCYNDIQPALRSVENEMENHKGNVSNQFAEEFLVTQIPSMKNIFLLPLLSESCWTLRS